MSEDQNIENLTKTYGQFLNYAERGYNFGFGGPSTYFYTKINGFHRKNSLKELLDDPIFYDYIYATLASWGMHRMGKRGAKMQEFTKFRDSILSCKNELLSLDRLSLETLQENQVGNVTATLSSMFEKLDLMQTKSKLVSVSKVLHFLLPNLIVPIDHEYTLWFFKINNLKNVEYEKGLFVKLFGAFVQISQKLKLDKTKCKGDLSQPSVAKLIDDAIIGYKLLGSK